MPRRRFDLTFPPDRATKQIIYHLVKDCDLTPNILRAAIQPGQEGRMLLEITGHKDAFDAGIALLEAEGITVAPAAADIVLDEGACVSCGLCTAVCRPDALTMGTDGVLVFEKDACVYCEACVVACPRRAITLAF